MQIMRVCETTACEWGLPIPMFGMLCTSRGLCQAIKNPSGSYVSRDCEDTRCTEPTSNPGWYEGVWE